MIVVAIIGILAAIAIPKFAGLLRKSREGSTKGNLGSMRSALSIYYGDMEGLYPTDMSSLTVSGKYLTAVPNTQTADYHPDSSAEIDSTSGPMSDSGGWFYNSSPTGPNFGSTFVNCSHTDTSGTTWTAY